MILGKGVEVAARSLLEDYSLTTQVIPGEPYSREQGFSEEFVTAVVSGDPDRVRAFNETVDQTIRNKIREHNKHSGFFDRNDEYVQGQHALMRRWSQAIRKSEELMPAALDAKQLANLEREAAREHELTILRESHAHAERLRNVDLEIEKTRLESERLRASAEFSDKAAERDYLYRLQELKAKIDEQMVRLTQPHDLQKQQAEMLKEFVRYQTELAEKADKTDAEREIDSIVVSIIKMFEMARSVPAPKDERGNVDTFAADAQYQMIMQVAGELIKARLTGAKKDLAG